jgi:predicted RNA binding protein YcfA (HicA-like mRNA interferase family)
MGFSTLPKARGRDHVEAFKSLGWRERKRKSGSHIILTNPSVPGAILSIPDHKEVSLGTLRQLVRVAGLDDEEYRNAFDNR